MPPKTVKVAVSLPAREFQRVETLRKKRHLSRSAAISEALRCWIGESTTRAKVEAYVAGYQRQPETADERAISAKLGGAALAAEDWEE